MWNNKHHVSFSVLNKILSFLCNRIPYTSTARWHQPQATKGQMQWWGTGDERSLSLLAVWNGSSHGSVRSAVCLQTAGGGSFKESVANGGVQRPETKYEVFVVRTQRIWRPWNPQRKGDFQNEIPPWTQRNSRISYQMVSPMKSRGRSWNHSKHVFQWKIHYQ